MESEPTPSAKPAETTQYGQIYSMVAEHFTIEEGFIEFDTPTFYVAAKSDLKQAFLRLYRELDSLKLVPFLRKRENRPVLQVRPKPSVNPNRPSINLILLLITIGTTFLTGYILPGAPNPWVGAVMFSVALLSILGAHEMAHKFTADKHKVEATYPYFIPGIPPMPTFGAVIQQKSLPPNRDALFDLGLSGPLVGFIVTIAVTIIGVQLSTLVSVEPAGSESIQTPLLFMLIQTLFPPSGQGPILSAHPVAFAGFIGMVVTMLNIIPVGQLDGGHVAYVLLKDEPRRILGFLALIALLFISVPMAVLAFLISRVPHPPPLDDVSELSRGRKLATILLVVIFVLSVVPIFSILDLLPL